MTNPSKSSSPSLTEPAGLLFNTLTKTDDQFNRPSSPPKLSNSNYCTTCNANFPSHHEYVKHFLQSDHVKNKQKDHDGKGELRKATNEDTNDNENESDGVKKMQTSLEEDADVLMWGSNVSVDEGFMMDLASAPPAESMETKGKSHLHPNTSISQGSPASNTKTNNGNQNMQNDGPGHQNTPVAVNGKDKEDAILERMKKLNIGDAIMGLFCKKEKEEPKEIIPRVSDSYTCPFPATKSQVPWKSIFVEEFDYTDNAMDKLKLEQKKNAQRAPPPPTPELELISLRAMMRQLEWNISSARMEAEALGHDFPFHVDESDGNEYELDMHSLRERIRFLDGELNEVTAYLGTLKRGEWDEMKEK